MVDPAFEGIIRLVDPFLVNGICHLFGYQPGKLKRLLPGRAAHIGVVADGFGNNVSRTLQGLLNSGHLLIKERLFDDVFEAALG